MNLSVLESTPSFSLLPSSKLPEPVCPLKMLPRALIGESCKKLTHVDLLQLSCCSVRIKSLVNSLDFVWLDLCQASEIRLDRKNAIHAKAIFKIFILRKRVKNFTGVPIKLLSRVLEHWRWLENPDVYFNKSTKIAFSAGTLLYKILAQQPEGEDHQENLSSLVSWFLATPGIDLNARNCYPSNSAIDRQKLLQVFPSEEGMSLLDRAMVCRYDAIACKIVGHGADIRYIGRNGYSLIEKARWLRLNGLVELLSEKNACFHKMKTQSIA